MQIYVKMDGRLGNQLFQYATARSIQIKNKGDLILDYTSYKLDKSKGIYGKDGMENLLVHFKVAPYEYIDCGNYDKRRIPLVQRVLFKIIRRIKPMSNRRWMIEIIEILEHRFLQFFGIIFLESNNSFRFYHLPNRNDLFLRGWFESSCFFDDIIDVLRKEIVPIYEIPLRYVSFYEKIQNTESVCVSVRRGDFTSDTYKKRFLICDVDYYKKGIEYIRNKKKNACIFVFSDDIEWCKNNLGLDADVIYEPEGMPIWEKLRFMSTCRNFVISNSTFSWWAQYLSLNKEKIVIAPRKWRNEKPYPIDIYQNNWILM